MKARKLIHTGVSYILGNTLAAAIILAIETAGWWLIYFALPTWFAVLILDDILTIVFAERPSPTTARTFDDIEENR